MYALFILQIWLCYYKLDVEYKSLASSGIFFFFCVALILFLSWKIHNVIKTDIQCDKRNQLLSFFSLFFLFFINTYLRLYSVLFSFFFISFLSVFTSADRFILLCKSTVKKKKKTPLSAISFYDARSGGRNKKNLCSCKNQWNLLQNIAKQ